MHDKRDLRLGMDRSITRRDFLHGFGGLTAGVMLPSFASPVKEPSVSQMGAIKSFYPPSLTGMRGNHLGSFEVMHELARENKLNWDATVKPDKDQFDLAIVGAGISGLSAAYFYRKERPDARILLLDNHDDFGGHAKRNEFDLDGRKLIGYGGAQTMAEPSGYPRIVKRLLRELGVDIAGFKKAYDQNFFKRHELSGGIYFNKEDWGSAATIPFDVANFREWMPLFAAPLRIQDAVTRMPLGDAAKAELLELFLLKENQMPHLSTDEKWDYLSTISYRNFLSRYCGITEEKVFAVFQDLTSDSGVGIEAVSAASALWDSGLPGWDAAGLPKPRQGEPYIHHYPDGNASIARQLVRTMCPQIATGKTMEDLITTNFDYSKLDLEDTPVRIRLNSTVVQVRHPGVKHTREEVVIKYISGGETHSVRAGAVIMACNNAAIPSICDELPEKQREALAFQVKVPILYTNVALTNWHAWKKLGVGAVACPGSYHINASLDFPVSIGEYKFATKPDDPVIVHMERFPHRSNEGLNPKDQFRLGRHELATTPFETIERSVRTQLSGILSAGGFDPARDIAGITVNLWAHGYSYWYRSLFDEEYDDKNDPRYPHAIARERFGQIAIANADSGASAMMETAIEQGYRAVTELLDN
ncbi:MAG: NAD(P)/FAD-dependent oxidoreductase [Cellvibrionales bacterium TMED148]|nr:MAG: NAD(P)/FAD-dependent oxidoreductase [Cellvibrionales bacterium TMED148]